MIILEFRFQENFHAASRLLEAGGVPFEFETPREDWRPSLIWLFEEQVGSEAHRATLKLARDRERLDRAQVRPHAGSNLAVPQ